MMLLEDYQAGQKAAADFLDAAARNGLRLKAIKLDAFQGSKAWKIGFRHVLRMEGFTKDQSGAPPRREVSE